MVLLRLGLILAVGCGVLASEPVPLRFPQPCGFVLHEDGVRCAPRISGVDRTVWAHPADSPDETWEFTDRIVLQIDGSVPLELVLWVCPLKLAKVAGPGLFVLQALSARSAWEEATRLSQLPGVQLAYPVHHAPLELSDRYASAPNDEFFRTRISFGPCEIEPGVVLPGQTLPGQWYLENRDPVTGIQQGVDLNIRSAWPASTGSGITVAVADTGVEMVHPDLITALSGAPHHDFTSGTADGNAYRRTSSGAHGTSVAGVIAAQQNNGIGISGVAPDAKLASWAMFDRNGRPLTDEQLSQLFVFSNATVAVQNHSWVPAGLSQRGPDALQDAALDFAWKQGRGGLGNVLVFAAGNGRAQGRSANDNGYASDPRTIGVTGVTPSGRATFTAEPGSSFLVAAPTGDDESGGLMTTDLIGTDGANYLSFCPSFEYLSDYRWGALGFKDTSAAAPQVAGVAALMLSLNPLLSARDVQQIFVLSAWHADLADPDLQTNGAGLRVSHNVGFGIVDAAEAVRLAQVWSNRPAARQLTLAANHAIPIPDGGYGVELVGDQVPAGLRFIPGLPGVGIQPDRPLAPTTVVDIGRATLPPTVSLAGQGALIERGDVPYAVKLANAAQAGARFAIIYNQETSVSGSCPGGDQLCVPSGTDFSPIPVIFITRSAGLALRDWLQQAPRTEVRIALKSAKLSFTVGESWQCERVGIRLRTDFTVRGDLRITLTSPSGTISTLQRYNGDTGVGPVDWTYWTTHHYFESTAGTWTLAVTDEAPGEGTGQILQASLVLNGVPVVDTDHDGLDDDWEIARFGSLQQGPRDDPDSDGYNNLREYLEGTDPEHAALASAPSVGFFNQHVVRLSWLGREGTRYQVRTSDALGNWNAVTEVGGRFPVTSTVIPQSNGSAGFFEVRPSP